jgi:plastocyanin
MPQVTDQIKQEHLKSRTRQSLSVLSKVTIVGLLGVALAVTANLLIVWLLHGTFVPEFFIGILPVLLVIGLIARRLRWASALGAGVALLIATLFLVDPNAQYTLSHPGNSFIDFVAEVIVLAFVLVVVVAGVGATIQNYQGDQPPKQQWLSPFLMGLTGVVVGMLIVAALAADNPVTNSASSINGGEPIVHMTADNFAQNVVLVPKGSKLLIVDDTSVEHILQNGIWMTNGTPSTLAEPGAPAVHNVEIKGGSVQIGPFSTVGIFHFYCTIHRGMNLTIVVQ